MAKILRKIANHLPHRIVEKLKRVAPTNHWAIWCFRFFKKAPMPRVALIDPVNFCVLNCPFCPTGTKRLKQKQTMLDLALFERILKQIPSLEKIYLFNWGEPLLNPALPQMVKSAKKKGIFLTIDTNLNVKKSIPFFKEVILSGLDQLWVSADGASQKTYEKYRQNGNLDLVFQNIRSLVKIKKELNQKNPKIIWKFIVNRYNEHELLLAEELAKEMEIELETSPMALGDNMPDLSFPGDFEQRMKEWLPLKKEYRFACFQKEVYQKPLFNTYCDQLFNSVTIAPDGLVYPCCFLTDPLYAFGDIKKEDFRAIWNNTHYTQARSLFIGKKSSDCDLKEGPSIICKQCQNFDKN